MNNQYTGGQKTLNLFAILSRASRAWLKYPWITALAIISIFVQQFFHTYFAYSLKLIIDNVLSGANDPPLGMVLVGLVIAFLLMSWASFGGEQVNARATAYIFSDIRHQLYIHLQKLSTSFYDKTQSGDLLSRFSGDLKALESGYTQAFLNVILIVLGLLINIPYMFYLDWRLALLAFFLIPVLFGLVQRQLPWSMQAGFRLRQKEADTLNLVQEAIQAQQVIKTFSLESVLTHRFQEKLSELRKITIESRCVVGNISKTSSIGLLFIQLVVVLVGAALVYQKTISVGAFISFTAILNVVMKDVYEFSKKVVPSLVEAATGVQRIEELLCTPIYVRDSSNAQLVKDFKQAICFDQVVFSYDTVQPQVKNVSLEILAGQSVAFVGSSGSGKSTLLNLLMRLYDPQSGQIFLDGQDLRSISLSSLRSQMSVVFQENYLFNTTIRENIRLGRPEATDLEIEEAARCAEIHETILLLPDGYDTQVGEAGGNLSGGQRQRIAIARAILANPKILLLDEATSALDPATEDAINQTLAKIGKGRTVISVTHRLHSAQNADQIFVMQQGLLVEQGTHAELLAMRGVYYELWQKQSGFVVSPDGRRARVDAERLRSIPLFARLQHTVLEEIACHFESEHYQANHTIVYQGERSDKMYLVVHGQAQVLVRHRGGATHFAEIFDDGDYFGETALLNHHIYMVSIQTITPCLFLTILSEDLLAIEEKYPHIAKALNAQLQFSMRNLQESIRPVVQSTRTARGRKYFPLYSSGLENRRADQVVSMAFPKKAHLRRGLPAVSTPSDTKPLPIPPFS